MGDNEQVDAAAIAAAMAADDDANAKGNPIPPLDAADPANNMAAISVDQLEALAAEFRAKLGLPAVPLAAAGVISATRDAEDQQSKTNASQRIKIMLQPNDDIPPTGLFLGHNGSSYLLKTGVWVNVPLPIIEILDNAVKFIPDVDPLTRRVVGWRPSLRFSYNIAPGSRDPREYMRAA